MDQQRVIRLQSLIRAAPRELAAIHDTEVRDWMTLAEAIDDLIPSERHPLPMQLDRVAETWRAAGRLIARAAR